ncbi:MAG: TlpA family protein disulfide reductase [Sandaracinaceae bacterium]
MSSSSPTRRGLRAAWPWLFFAAAIGLWVVESLHHDEALPEGATAPSVSFEGERGSFALDELRGHTVVLAFWASWCSACRAEAPVLSRVHRAIEARGDRVIGASVDEMELAEIRGHAQRFGITYEVARATARAVTELRVDLLPTIYVIAPDGTIVESFTGVASEETILDAVERARTRTAGATARFEGPAVAAGSPPSERAARETR